MRVLIVWLAVAVAGCFAPEERDGVVTCSDSGGCPPGFSCASNRLCYRQPPSDGDAQVVDARLDDAGSDVDAAPDGGDFLPQCSDGVDNDCDGQVDFPNDPGCADALDPNERGMRQCDDGVDNDNDGATDFKFGAGCGVGDPQCSNPGDQREDQ